MIRIRGFTLLELLLALALLSLVLGALLAASARSAGQLRAARWQTDATECAENVLADLGYGIPLRAGSVDGPCDAIRQQWRVRVSKAPPAAFGSGPEPATGTRSLYAVELDVVGPDGRLRWRTLRQGPSAP